MILLAKLFIYFLTGFALFVILNSLLNHSKNKLKVNSGVDNSISNHRKTRILCFIPTTIKYFGTRLVHVQNTWAKHCDKMIFTCTATNKRLGAVGLNVPDGYFELWPKVRRSFLYIHDTFIDDYDWFYKADDNTFAIIENMRFMLAAHNPNDPIHFGYKQKILLYPEAAEFGGTGYVLSNKAVRLLTEKFLRKNKTCSNLERMEDWNISLCLYKAGCIHGVGRDEIERERFVPESVITHFFTTRSMSGRFYKDDEGLDYVSNYAVSFHEILPQQLYSMYYLIHYLKVFGIQHRYPPLPRALSFSEEKFLWKQEQSKYF